MSAAAPARRTRGLAPGIKSDPIPVVENLVVWTAAVFGMISALATLGIVVAFVGEVIARWVGQPFDPTNIVSGLLVTATFSGLAWTTIRGEHVSVQFVADRFGPRTSRVVDIVIWTVGSAYLVWLVIESFQTAVVRTWVSPDLVSDGVSLVSRAPWRWVFSIATVPFALVALLNLTRAILGRHAYDDVEDLAGEAAEALAVTRDETEVAVAIESAIDPTENRS